MKIIGLDSPLFKMKIFVMETHIRSEYIWKRLHNYSSIVNKVSYTHKSCGHEMLNRHTLHNNLYHRNQKRIFLALDIVF